MKYIVLIYLLIIFFIISGSAEAEEFDRQECEADAYEKCAEDFIACRTSNSDLRCGFRELSCQGEGANLCKAKRVEFEEMQRQQQNQLPSIPSTKGVN